MTSPVAPLCECHGEPCYWHKKKDMRAGGLWRCRVRKRETDRAVFQRRYDTDAVFRISKQLAVRSQGCAKTLLRMKENLGSLP